MLLKEGKVISHGSYEKIVETGFNIKDILDSFNVALKDKAEDNKADKGKFKKEEVSPEKKTEKESPSKKTEANAVTTVGNEDKKKVVDLVVPEKRIEGGVGFKDYRELFSFSLGICGIILYAFISIAASLLQLAPSYVISIWTSKELEEQQDKIYMQLFVFGIIGYMIFVFFRSVLLQWIVLTSTNRMHNTMAEKVIRATILFFDSNPQGRITTRF